MTTKSRRCTTCGDTKSSDQFYLLRRSRPHGPRRSKCKDCSRAAAVAYKRDGPSLARKVQNEIMQHGGKNPEALSPEVRDAVFPNKPIDETALAAYRKRLKDEKTRERRRERERNHRALHGFGPKVTAGVVR